MKYFDPYLLQTLVAFAESGTLNRAADIVGRTPSAVTSQMQRLQEDAGVNLFVSQGRNRVLTPAGDQLVTYARAILKENQNARLRLSGMSAHGELRLGVTQDFTTGALVDVLRQFATTHPLVRLEMQVARSFELSELFQNRKLDVICCAKTGQDREVYARLEEPMVWIAGENFKHRTSDDLSLALLQPPCGFRDRAINVLEQAEVPFRLAATSLSLAGLETVLQAGLAVTLRTEKALKPGLKVVSSSFLPDPGSIAFTLHIRDDVGSAAKSFGNLMKTAFSFQNGK